jgi:3-methyladenine DNA glycosylase AlkD
MKERITAAGVRRALRELASPARARSSAWFFKAGPGEYGEGDRFLGVSVPDQRRVARRFRALPEAGIERLLASAFHEHRLTALLILCDRYTRATTGQERRALFRLYMRRLERVDNWDLVDTSAPVIVGGWLATRPRGLLDRMAASRRLWTRRVAMLATFHSIRAGDATDALRIARALRDDPHDLIHKAVGWMLREVGKRVGAEPLRGFLRAHAAHMPRTMLRYAIERLPATERARWLAAGVRRATPPRPRAAAARAGRTARRPRSSRRRSAAR